MTSVDSIRDVGVGSRVRQTPEEGWRTYRAKRCGNNHKDEDSCLKILDNDKKNVLFCFECAIFVTVSHRTGLDTRSMTRSRLKSG